MCRNRKRGGKNAIQKDSVSVPDTNATIYIHKLTARTKWDQSHASNKQWRQGQTMFLGRFAHQLRDLKKAFTERHVAKIVVEKNHT